MVTSFRKDWMWAGLLICGLMGCCALQLWHERGKSVGPVPEEELYLKSGKTLKTLSLGFDGLLADIYWLRTIQYFGEKSLQQRGSTLNVGNVSSWKLTLLGSMISITTELDPQYIAAYRFAALFMPDVDPKIAIDLAERGIRDNPEDWRLYQDLAFICWKLKKYPDAAQAYKNGSTVPRAPKWMSQMAAVMLAKGGDRETARQMFIQIYETTDDTTLRRTSFSRLMYFRAEDEVQFLNRLLVQYEKETGTCPRNLAAFVRILPMSTRQLMQNGGMSFDSSSFPLDPFGTPYAFNGNTCTAGIDAGSEVARWKD